jgi:DNA-binding NtrC family response regulator
MNNSPQKPQSSQTDVSGSFSTVISMVEKSWDISKALAKLGINRTTFYRKITKEQKCLLDMAKTQNTKYGVGSKGR